MLHNIRWRIAIPYVALILLSTLGLTAFLSAQVRQVRAGAPEHLLPAIQLDARVRLREPVGRVDDVNRGVAVDSEEVVLTQVPLLSSSPYRLLRT